MSIGQEFDDGTVVIQAKRRWTELFMLLIAWAIGFGGWVLTELNINHSEPSLLRSTQNHKLSLAGIWDGRKASTETWNWTKGSWN